jgi:uroporphyrinogen-III synthase
VTETRPTILLTRPEPQSRALAGRLRQALGDGIPILVSPVLEIVPVSFDLPFAPDYVILTSVHAADAARAAGLSGIPAYCVGDRTAEAAAAAGLLARSAGGDGADLIALLLEARPDGRGLYLRGQHVASDLGSALHAAGLDPHAAIAYDQAPRPLSSEAKAILADKKPVILPVFSPRSSRLLAAEIGRAAAPLDLIAISAKAAAPWQGTTASLIIAAAPDGPSMEHAIVGRARARSAC